jgi:hypothetical protein
MISQGSTQRRLAQIISSALMVAGLVGAEAHAAPPLPGQVNFTAPTLFPKFSPNVEDYVVRCKNRPVTVRAHTAAGWEAAVGNHPFRGGDFNQVVPLSAGRPFRIVVREVGVPQLYRYYVRCLPNSFPNYAFTRYAPVSPQYFSVDRAFASNAVRYAIIFNNRGVPVWWKQIPSWATRVLPNGNILWHGGLTSPRRWATYRLNGSLVRPLYGVGRGGDAHDLAIAPNGNHLIGAYVQQGNVNTSPYGGSPNATVINTELQEVSPQGNLVWSWRSQHHIGREETGRWWPRVIRRGAYDILHWNSVEPAGSAVIASFRHLDAVYKIDKRTGQIVWKLGGTRTPESLRVINDPRGYTLGAQHDARQLPDGTVTVFDNRTHLRQRPRAVRFRIDEASGTATLMQSITDPAVSSSGCCGSARRLANGDWLIYWGGPTNRVGGYKANGQKTFALTLHASYRAEPVPEGVLSAQELRNGMNAMYGSP